VITKIWSITKKELKSYYNSPIAYIIAVVFLVFMSLWLFIIQQFFIRNVADLRNYFMVIPNVFIFLIPAITMRSWAEEKKLGTEELLLTLPLKEYQVVVGKFLAALILLLTAIILTLPVPLSLNGFGNFEWGQIIGQYLGVIFFGGACIAIGLFVSSLSMNQIVSFIFCTFALFLVIVINVVPQTIQLPDFIANILNNISLGYHFDSLSKGLLDSRDILYFILVCIFFLYLNTKVLIFKKWK